MLRTCVSFESSHSLELILTLLRQRLEPNVVAASGATLELKEGDHHLFVLCERVDDRWFLSINSPAGGLINVGMNFDTPFMRKLIGRVHAALSGMSTVVQIAWHFTKDWNAGQRNGVSEPFA